MPQEREGSAVAAFGWMLLLSIILGIFLPTIGPIIAGSEVCQLLVWVDLPPSHSHNAFNLRRARLQPSDLLSI